MYRMCNIKGIGRASVRKLVDFFGSAYNVSKADINILKKSGILNGRQIDEFAFSMKNKDMLINDKSVELTSLYNNIKYKNKSFVSNLQSLQVAWVGLEKVLDNNIEFFIL